MSCNYYNGKCVFLNGKEDGCIACPIKRAYNKGVRDTKKDYERPQGEWIKFEAGRYTKFYKCSLCGRVINTFKENPCNEYPFCHCGAEMRGGKE